MAKQSRLRVQKEKKSRRIILFTVLVTIASITCWQLETRYGLVDRGREILTSIEETFTASTSIRGTVYDRNFKQIAVTMERVSVYARTREIGSIHETVRKLGVIFPLDEQLLQEKLESGVLRIWVAKDINQEQEVAVKNEKIPGIHLQRGEKRFYPNGSQAAHLIGYVRDSIGLSGVEYHYDRLLASRNVERQQEHQSTSISQDLVLTVDLKIQYILEKIVKDISTQGKADRVAAYLLENATGEVVGGAQIPTFDPNTFTSYSQDVLENIFLAPIVLPDKFRFFLRDAAMLHANGETGILPTSWSLAPPNTSLGSQLRLWELLGLNESLSTDFYPDDMEPKTRGRRAGVAHLEQQQLYGLSPESVTPLNLLTAFSVLLSGGQRIRPFMVKNIIDPESGVEVLQVDNTGSNSQTIIPPATAIHDIDQLFRVQSIEGEGKTFSLRDHVPVVKGPHDLLMINDMTIVSIPAGGADMTMLVVVERGSGSPEQKKTKSRRSIEQIVGEKVERISILQQVAKSVSDVVEPELLREGNYHLENIAGDDELEIVSGKEEGAKVLRIMPDLQGLSLRKSLRLLQGIKIKIKIQGTGRVVSQKPNPGAKLQGVGVCFLVLEKDENMTYEKMSKVLSEKK